MCRKDLKKRWYKYYILLITRHYSFNFVQFVGELDNIIPFTCDLDRGVTLPCGSRDRIALVTFDLCLPLFDDFVDFS